MSLHGRILLSGRHNKSSRNIMKNIQLVHEGEDYIRVSFEGDNGARFEIDVFGETVGEIIKTLGTALYKESFIKK